MPYLITNFKVDFSASKIKLSYYDTNLTKSSHDKTVRI